MRTSTHDPANMITRGRSTTVGEKSSGKQRAATVGPSEERQEESSKSAKSTLTIEQLIGMPGLELPELETEDSLHPDYVALIGELSFDLSSSPLYNVEKHPKNSEILGFYDFSRRCHNATTRARLFIYLYEH